MASGDSYPDELSPRVYLTGPPVVSGEPALHSLIGGIKDFHPVTFFMTPVSGRMKA